MHYCSLISVLWFVFDNTPYYKFFRRISLTNRQSTTHPSPLPCLAGFPQIRTFGISFILLGDPREAFLISRAGMFICICLSLIETWRPQTYLSFNLESALWCIMKFDMRWVHLGQQGLKCLCWRTKGHQGGTGPLCKQLEARTLGCSRIIRLKLWAKQCVCARVCDCLDQLGNVLATRCWITNHPKHSTLRQQAVIISVSVGWAWEHSAIGSSSSPIIASAVVIQRFSREHVCLTWSWVDLCPWYLLAGISVFCLEIAWESPGWAMASPELVIQGENSELLRHCHCVRLKWDHVVQPGGWYPRRVPPAELGTLLTIPDTQMFLYFIRFQYQFSIR